MYTTDDMGKTQAHRGSSLQDYLTELADKDPDFPAYLERSRRRAALAMKIRTLREKAGLSQAQLAKRAGMYQPGIARIENGRSETSVETLEKVATALGCSLVVDLAPKAGRTAKH